MSDEMYSAQEVKEYGDEMVRQYSQERANTHTFLTKVIESEDTTKTGNLSEEELGASNISFKGLKELELFCKDIYNDDSWANYFKSAAEIQTASSLSKEGFLLRLSVTNKQQLENVTKTKKKNKGWFGSKKREDN